jgi:hypothetical protein
LGALPTGSLEADAETTQAVQRVFNLVRNGHGPSNGKEPALTLDDVVRFYNVSPPADFACCLRCCWLVSWLPCGHVYLPQPHGRWE